jgi:hypothetical protein
VNGRGLCFRVCPHVRRRLGDTPTLSWHTLLSGFASSKSMTCGLQNPDWMSQWTKRMACRTPRTLLPRPAGRTCGAGVLEGAGSGKRGGVAHLLCGLGARPASRPGAPARPVPLGGTRRGVMTHPHGSFAQVLYGRRGGGQGHGRNLAYGFGAWWLPAARLSQQLALSSGGSP